jgi:hypothetical protein
MPIRKDGPVMTIPWRIPTAFKRLLKNVMSAGKTRQNSAKNCSLCVINEYFEPNFNAVWPSAIVFQPPDRLAGEPIRRMRGQNHRRETTGLRRRKDGAGPGPDNVAFLQLSDEKTGAHLRLPATVIPEGSPPFY